MSSARIKLSALMVQGASCLSIYCLSSLTGSLFAWPSFTIENFISNQTVLSHPMSSTEVSLLGSLANIGALIGTPLAGYALTKLGRKYSAMIFGLPYVLAWTIISATTNVSLVLASIGLAGFGASGQVVSSVYVPEICQDSIRGALSSAALYMFFLGLLFSYVIGGRLTYYQVVYTQLTLSVLYVVLLALLHESPVYLLQNGRKEEAAKAIAYYRRVNIKSKEVQLEISKIKLQLDPRIDQILQEKDLESASKLYTEKVSNNNIEINEKYTISAWNFLVKSESSKRALAAVLIVIIVSILMGSVVLQVYAEPLFKEAVPSMSPNLCSILLAVDFLLASLLCATIVDKFGRKLLLTTTSGICGICTLLLGSQLHLKWGPHWFTAFIIYLYSFVYNMGAATVPYILISEVFLPEVRGLGNSLSMACMWSMYFVTLAVFNPLVELFGLGQVFYGFSVVCFLGALYGYFCLPETKGLSVDAIQLLFLKRR